VAGDLDLSGVCSDMRRLCDRQARAPYPARKPAQNVANKIRPPSMSTVPIHPMRIFSPKL